MTKIYHNPRCSKSRATLELLQQNGIEPEPEIVRYLEEPPDSSTLNQITQGLGCSISDIVRHGEAICKELNIKNINLDEQDLVDLVAKNPILLERPIVLHKNKAAVGRPPENVLTLFRD